MSNLYSIQFVNTIQTLINRYNQFSNDIGSQIFANVKFYSAGGIIYGRFK